MRLFTSVSGKSLAPCVHTRKEWSQFLTQSQESRDTNRKVFQWIDYTSNAFIHWPQCTEFMHKSENSTKTTINIWSKKNQPITVIPKQLLQHKVLHLTDMKKASERRWSSQVWNTKICCILTLATKTLNPLWDNCRSQKGKRDLPKSSPKS
jgi:hypothetical protein